MLIYSLLQALPDDFKTEHGFFLQCTTFVPDVNNTQSTTSNKVYIHWMAAYWEFKMTNCDFKNTYLVKELTGVTHLPGNAISRTQLHNCYIIPCVILNLTERHCLCNWHKPYTQDTSALYNTKEVTLPSSCPITQSSQLS
jgi:hypothetical protein